MTIHILLVDDDEDEHLFFRWSLEKIDAKINLLCALTSVQAYEIVKNKIPDLIFLDINLPGSDGFECLEELKRIPLLKDIPVYMYSTEITDKSLWRAKMLGAAGCLKKSRTYDGLGKSISEILKATAAKPRQKNILL